MAKTALITGASSGIGASIAKQLAAKKYDCILTARRTDRMESLAKELDGVKVRVIASDLGTRDGADKLIAEAGDDIDVLVNNAGFGVYGKFAEQSLDRVMQMVALNLVSLTTLTHHYVKCMVAKKSGRVLQVSSIGAYQPSPLYAVYSATKSYVLSFSEAINFELKGTGVSVTTICPGVTATEFHEVADHPKPKWMEMFTMTADDVAAIGIRAMENGRAVVTPGFSNKMTAFFVKLVPRSWATAMASRTMQPGS